MTLDPLLLDVLACPVDKEPLLWFADEEHPLQPPAPQELPGGRRGARPLGGGGRGRERRRARTPDRQGREGGRARHRARSGVTHPQYLDTLGVWDATVGLPEQCASPSIAADGRAARHRAPATRRHPLRRRLRHGDQRHGGRGGGRLRRRRTPRSPSRSATGTSRPRSSDRTRSPSPSRPRATPRRPLPPPSARPSRGAHLVVVSGGGALAEMAAASDLPLFGVPADLPAPRTALGALTGARAADPVARLGIIPDVAPSLDGVRTSLRRRRDALVGPGGPAEEVARLIGRTIPLVYGSDRVDRGGRPALEDPDQRERQDAGLLRASSPSSPTTRSPAGVSTGT